MALSSIATVLTYSWSGRPADGMPGAAAWSPPLDPVRTQAPLLAASRGRGGAARGGAAGRTGSSGAAPATPPPAVPSDLLRAALDGLDVGVIVCGLDLRLRFANRTAGALLGHEARLQLGRRMPVCLRRAIRAGASLAAAAPRAAILRGPGPRLLLAVKLLDAETLLLLLTSAEVPPRTVGDLLGAFGLPVQQRRVVELVRQGLNNRAIAAALELSAGTVKQYLAAVFATFQVGSRVELVALLDELLRAVRVGAGPDGEPWTAVRA
ncbi:MAG TPA: helix-turn-helix transcriptional regulator [Polyangia bacterium]